MEDQTYKIIFSYLVRRCKHEKGRRMLRQRYSTDAIHLVSNTKKGSFVINKVAWLSLPIPARDIQYRKEKSQEGQVCTRSVPKQTLHNFTWFFGGQGHCSMGQTVIITWLCLSCVLDELLFTNRPAQDLTDKVCVHQIFSPFLISLVHVGVL